MTVSKTAVSCTVKYDKIVVTIDETTILNRILCFYVVVNVSNAQTLWPTFIEKVLLSVGPVCDCKFYPATF